MVRCVQLYVVTENLHGLGNVDNQSLGTPNAKVWVDDDDLHLVLAQFGAHIDHLQTNYPEIKNNNKNKNNEKAKQLAQLPY